jgi:hypothetical protein
MAGVIPRLVENPSDGLGMNGDGGEGRSRAGWREPPAALAPRARHQNRTSSASLGRPSSASTRLWCSIHSRVRGQIQPVTVSSEP